MTSPGDFSGGLSTHGRNSIQIMLTDLYSECCTLLCCSLAKESPQYFFNISRKQKEYNIIFITENNVLCHTAVAVPV